MRHGRGIQGSQFRVGPRDVRHMSAYAYQEGVSFVLAGKSIAMRRRSGSGAPS